MSETVLMKKGGQVRKVPQGKLKRMIDDGFVEVKQVKDKLVEVGGTEDLAVENAKLKKEIAKLKKELAETTKQ